jgi:plastocyanin
MNRLDTLGRTLAIALLAAGATLAGTARAQADAATATVQRGSQVEIRQFAFAPAQLTVPVGTRVVWTNRDDEPHVVASTDGAFPSSPALDTDGAFAMVFTKAGTYAYFCSIHPMMRGTVVVR